MQLTVVMPAYNEAPNIRAAVADVVAHVFAAVPDAELVVVDDGSRDATPEVLAGIAADEPRVRVLSQANAGHGAALRAGMDAARGDHLLLLDSDRQVALDDFPAHWARLGAGPERIDAVLGVRAARHDPAHRLAISWILRRCLAAMFAAAPRDANVPYKLVPSSAWAAARPAIAPGCLIPSALLGVWLMRADLRVAEVEVTHRPRAAGETVLRAGRLARFCWRAMGDLWRFRRALRGD